MKQAALFETPIPEPLVTPKGASTGLGPVRYTKYSGKFKCDDCVLWLHERGQQGLGAPPARFARQRRAQGDSVVLLCHEHANLRKEAGA